MSLRKSLSPIAFIAASLFGLSSVASASIINVLVETNEFDAVSVDGFFEFDTTNPESWEVTNWSLDVAVTGDPNLNPFNTMAVADATSSTFSFMANDPMAACDLNGDCIQSLDLTFASINGVQAGAMLSLTSLCATTSWTVGFAPATTTVCNSNPASVTFTVTSVTGGTVPGVPEPGAGLLFAVGFVVVRRATRRKAASIP